MLLMFLVGTGSVGWMLLLGLVMAKPPLGPPSGEPLGATLLGGAALVIALHSSGA